jgi:hypothetical protein
MFGRNLNTTETLYSISACTRSLFPSHSISVPHLLFTKLLTGTLTQNRMTVENIWTNGRLHAAAMFRPPPATATMYTPPEEVMEAEAALSRNTLNRYDKQVVKHWTVQQL